jgi:hypothetical protein
LCHRSGQVVVGATAALIKPRIKESSMQFHIDSDGGTSIAGWLVPDNPAAIPKIVIASPGHLKEFELEANVLRTDLKDLGLHSSGMAGFLIDEQLVPDLGKIDDIEIRDSVTRLLIHRRSRDSYHLQRKFFFYGQHAMPQTPLDTLLSKHFALNYQAIEQHSFDTLYSIINNQFATSIFLSGRPRLYRYRQLLRERGFTIVTLLRDPYEELAERLLFIRYASNKSSPSFTANYMTGLEVLVDMVRRMDFGERDSFAAAFKVLNDPQRQALANPFVRTLACQLDESPEPKHVSIALDNLAGMDLVGLTTRFDEFKSTLSELLRIDMLGDCQLGAVSWVPIIASHLRNVEQVEGLLSLDLELVTHVGNAITKALDGR